MAPCRKRGEPHHHRRHCVGLVLLALICLIGCAAGAVSPTATATHTSLPSVIIISDGARDGIVENWAVVAEKDGYGDTVDDAIGKPVALELTFQ